jgi:hypothetical protein
MPSSARTTDGSARGGLPTITAAGSAQRASRNTRAPCEALRQVVGVVADTFRDGVEKIATQEVELRQEGELIYIAIITRGLAVEEGGYHWNGELRLWDNEVLMGSYAANDGSIRSKGTMYFVLDAHGLHMSGRWVGLGYDDKIMTGWGSMAKTHDEAEAGIARLSRGQGEAGLPTSAAASWPASPRPSAKAGQAKPKG